MKIEVTTVKTSKILMFALIEFLESENNDLNTDNLTINQLKQLILEFIDEETFENSKLSDLFEKYLPNYKHSSDWITAFSVKELKLLIKLNDNSKDLYDTKLDSIKLLISKEQTSDFAEVVHLKEEKKLKQNIDDRCCKICMELPMDCVYFDCKHICSCMKCAEKLEKCPVCREMITQRVKVIIS